MEFGAASMLHSGVCRPVLSPCSSPWLPITSQLRRHPSNPSLYAHCRTSILSKDREYFGMHGALRKYQAAQMVLISCGPDEEIINNWDSKKTKYLVDCEMGQDCLVGGMVALGKFDALHIGHRELAIHASKAGVPFLLSFAGMAEVLGLESRAPIVANCDRKRVLSSWSPYCGNVVPIEYHIEFSSVRHFTPRQFVEMLSKELRICGVVAGENYRFGYKASADASELLRLCMEYDLFSIIVISIMDKSGRSSNGAVKVINPNDKGQVSSTRIRQALAMGDMEYVAELLGRKHRLMFTIDEGCVSLHHKISIPRTCMLNQPPGDGVYSFCRLLIDNELVGSCRVTIDPQAVDLEVDIGLNDRVKPGLTIGIEF